MSLIGNRYIRTPRYLPNKETAYVSHMPRAVFGFTPFSHSQLSVSRAHIEVKNKKGAVLTNSQRVAEREATPSI